MRLLPLALALVIALSAAAHVSAATAATHCSNLAPRAELACGQQALHQARSGLRWTRNHAALAESAHTHTIRFWLWRERVAQRWIAQARHALRPRIAHLALWLCVHRTEGAWNDPDSGHSGHFGGLQMTSPWGQGSYYVYRADRLTPAEQMWKAELGYVASGYSTSWLLSQWYHPECLRYAG